MYQHEGLFNACYSGNVEIVEKFLREGISPNVQTSEGVTPLQVASANGHIETIQFLLENGAAIDLPNHYGWTPLMHAARHGHSKAISVLLKKKAKINICNKLGLRPVVAAAWSGEISAVQLLIEAGAILDHMPSSLVQSGECDLSSLMAVALQGHTDLLQFLLEKGAFINEASPITGLTPLMLAACFGHAQAVQILVQCGADVNKTTICDQNALDIATTQNELKVKSYLENKIDVRPNEVSYNQAVKTKVETILQQKPKSMGKSDSHASESANQMVEGLSAIESKTFCMKGESSFLSLPDEAKVKSPYSPKVSPKKSHQSTGLKGWLDGVTQKILKQSSRGSDAMTGTVPDVQTLETNSNEVFLDKSTVDASDKNLSFSILLSPNKATCVSLRVPKLVKRCQEKNKDATCKADEMGTLSVPPTSPQLASSSPDFLERQTLDDNKGDLTTLLSKESLQKYVQKFREQEVDLEAFRCLTDDDLNEIGVKTGESRDKLLNIIKELRNS